MISNEKRRQEIGNDADIIAVCGSGSFQHRRKPASGEWVYKDRFHGRWNDSLDPTKIAARY